MPFLLALLALLGAAAFWIMRARNAADAAHDILDAANDVRLAARRFGFRRRNNTHPVESIEEPAVAVATLGVSFLELDVLPGREQQDALEMALQSGLSISADEAGELVVLGRWLMGQCGTPDQAITRTARKLYKLDQGQSFPVLMEIVQKVSAGDGGTLSPRQGSALDEIRRAFRLS